MVTEWATIIYTWLNSAVFLGVFIWFIRKHIIPAVRYNMHTAAANLVMLEQETGNYNNEVIRLHEEFALQEQETNRLTLCVQKWAHVLELKNALAVLEYQESYERYKKRLDDNELIRICEKKKRIVSKQVLHNVRAELIQLYKYREAQMRYMNTVYNLLHR